MPEVCCQY